MTIVTLTDIHGSDRYLEACAHELARADLVVIAGDITNFGGRQEAAPIIEKIRGYNEAIVAVTGNCDNPDVEDYLDSEGLNIGARNRVVGGIWFAGLGGSLPGPAPTPNTFSEEELAALLERAAVGLSDPFILVSHQPAAHTRTDLVLGMRHVGSASVRSFIERTAPLVCFSGHIHEAIGTDSIGRTHLVNPGPFRSGKFAKAEVDGSGRVVIELRQL